MKLVKWEINGYENNKYENSFSTESRKTSRLFWKEIQTWLLFTFSLACESFYAFFIDFSLMNSF